MRTDQWVSRLETACVAVFFAWLAWIPMPFGSVIERARLPLVVVPLSMCAVVATLRLFVTSERSSTAQPTTPWVIWAGGSLGLIVLGALQLMPLPPSLLARIAPGSHTIWALGARLGALSTGHGARWWPLTVSPSDTRFELVRAASLAGVFMVSAILIRNHSRRRALAGVLCAIAVFEAIYGLREAALQRYEIWGWVNRLIFDRVTGTFVNPNHFAHYIAIVLPMALFLAAIEWHYAASPRAPVPYRLAAIMERGPILMGFALLAAATCVAAVLLAQSRGALLAIVSGVLVVAAMLPGRRMARVAFSGAAAVVVFGAVVYFLGSERTVRRFVPSQVEVETMVGRRIGIGAGMRLWGRFPVFGSGLGTFERVVLMEQDQDLAKIYHHAHNDYVEMAATGGAVGLAVVVAALAGGYVALVRLTFGAGCEDITWKRRAFQAAALLSLTIAMVHALYDFNFFIPANPATLAAILGAAVSSLDHDRRTSL